MAENGLKVTDRRMFTADGELREEYRFLEDVPPASAETAAEAGPTQDEAPEAVPPGSGRAAPASSPAAEPPPQASRPQAPPEEEPPADGPGFLDLVSMLAEQASMFLGEARFGDPRARQSLEMARAHIDLLSVLRTKTAGNLDAQESAVLEDVIYRLRMAFVQKRG